MKRNKYIENLGISIKNYGSHFIKDRKIKRFLERRKYGFDSRQIVNMDIIFAEWIYSRLTMFKEQTVDDLNFNSVEFEGQIYTIEQAINRIIEASKGYLLQFEKTDTSDEKIEQKVCREMKSATYLWAEIMPYIDLVTISKKVK